MTITYFDRTVQLRYDAEFTPSLEFIKAGSYENRGINPIREFASMEELPPTVREEIEKQKPN